MNQNDHKTLFVSYDEVESVLSMEECIGCMEDAFKALAAGNVQLPLRNLMWLPDNKNMLGLMPTVMKMHNGESIFGLKVLSIFNTNVGTSHHTHQGAILLFEGSHGQMQAIIDAFSVTKMRTAAVSGLATRILARSDHGGASPLTCAILGSGPQAESHILAMMAVRKISKFVLWSRTASNAAKLKDKMAAKIASSTEIIIANTVEEAVKGVDIVCTLTGSKEPIIHRDWLKAGVHINAVGAHTSTTRELDSQTIKDSKLYADKRESLLNESGDYLIPLKEGMIESSHLLYDLAELVTLPQPPSRKEDDITVFKSLGLALEDLASAKLIYDRCKQKNLGSWKQMCEPPVQL